MVRREQTIDGETFVNAFDGATLWMQHGERAAGGGAGAAGRLSRQDAEFDSVFVDYKEKGHSVELVGREKRDDGEVFHLRVTKKGGPPQDYYLDAETGLEKAMS